MPLFDVYTKCAEEPFNAISLMNHHLSQSNFRVFIISDTKSPCLLLWRVT